MHIENFTSKDLHIESFTMGRGEAWCFIGSNRSGIDRFVQFLSGDLSDYSAQNLVLPHSPALVSFARQQDVFEEELKKDDTDFLDRIDPGTPACHFLQGSEDISHLINAFGMQEVQNRGYRQLSTGESRKLMLLQALAQKKDFLVIQNPYDGLDRKSCQELNKALETLQGHNIQLLITINNRCDIPRWCTHLARFHNGTISLQGKRETVLPKIMADPGQTSSKFILVLKGQGTENTKEKNGQELVSLQNGSARYGNVTIFSRLNLTIKEGRHTLITGPNGSGKSTLLQILTGDNQQCYANALRMFGRRRGTGESIWDIKREMGIVSSDLHRDHYIPGNILHVVISGLFDSIGLYKKYRDHQRKDALWWLSLIGIADKAHLPFKKLPYAEQRLVLIARALIKMPRLLVLDEPTQGLDENNRDNLLAFLEKISEKQLSTIIYASHRQDEFRDFFQQHIRLENYSSAI